MDDIYIPSNNDYWVRIDIAKKDELLDIINYLIIPEIDLSFVRPLSQRNISIKERVYTDFNKWYWLVLKDNDNLIRWTLACIMENNIAYLSTFSVSNVIVGHGFGKKLIFDVEMILKSLFPEINAIFLDSWSTNKWVASIMKEFWFTKIKEYEDKEKRVDWVKTVLYKKDI